MRKLWIAVSATGLFWFFVLLSEAVLGPMKCHDKGVEAIIMTQRLTQSVMEYQLDNRKLPEHLSDLVFDPGLAGWTGPYIKQKDLKDPWGAEYGYLVDHERGEFMVYTWGRDRRPGGEDLDHDQIVAGKPRL